MASDIVGGYKYKNVAEPLDMAVCKVCHLPSREPQLSACCGHSFCKSCLDTAKDTGNSSCPTCCAEEFTVFPNKQMDRFINDLQVFCVNKEKGCDWQGEMKNIEKHLTSDDGCHFEDVECSNKCGSMLQRQDLVNHTTKECQNRMITCPHCNIAYYFYEGEQHNDHCTQFPLPCPNQCESEIAREDMEVHKDECTLETVHCEYYYHLGCDATMLRKDKKYHNEQNMENHLSMALSKIIKSDATVKSLEEELKTAKDEVQVLKKDLEQEREKHKSQLSNVEEELVKRKYKDFEGRAERTMAEIKQQLSFTNAELEQKLKEEDKDLTNTHVKYLDMIAVRDEIEQKVTNTNGSISQRVKTLKESEEKEWPGSEIESILTLRSKYDQIEKTIFDINQELATIDLHRIRTEEKLKLQIKQAEQEMSSVHQRFVSTKLHINKKQADLTNQLDKNLESLMQEEYATQTTKDEMTAFQLSVKNSCDELTQKLSCKEEGINKFKQQLNTFTQDITGSTDDKLRKLKELHDDIKRKLQVQLEEVNAKLEAYLQRQQTQN